MKEQAIEDRGAAGRAGEGPCGLVIKPLRPDVHLNQKLFPVVVVVFFIYSILFSVCQKPSYRKVKVVQKKKIKNQA